MMNWNRHAYLLRLSENDLLVYLRQHGYIFCRDTFVWGRMLMFQDVESGVKKWYIDGGLRDWPEVTAYLKETWLPVGKEECDWFVTNLG